MKFGDNLNNLSIPEWKSYNLDYNDIKLKIKQLTKRASTLEDDDHSDLTQATADNRIGNHRPVTLKSLQSTFIDNFNYVDLFIITKRGELERKLLQSQKVFGKYSQPNSHISTLDFQIKLNELKYQVLEISRVLRNLNRFIILQKVACNKIFKKFLKYYPKEDTAAKFIHNLKVYLSTNPNSFINIDLTNLTLELSFFLDCTDEELKRLESTPNVDEERRQSKSSLFSNKSFSSTSPNSVTYTPNPHPYAKLNSSHNPISLQAHPRLHQQQIPSSNNAKFDLDIVIKKNFKIDCLIADNHNLNDLLLNLHVLINCESLNDELTMRRNSTSSLASYFLQNTSSNTNASSNHSLLSYTYLTSPHWHAKDSLEQGIASSPEAEVPAYIISQFNQPTSAIISHVGGLRRFTYCFLPNEIVQMLLNHLIDPSEETFANELLDWFTTNTASPLTKMAIDWILNKNLKPTLKLITKRSRYIIRKSDNDKFTGTGNSLNQGDGDSNNGVSKNSSDEPEEDELPTRNLEDDYLLCLDQDIVTTNNPLNVQNIAFDERLTDFERDTTCISNLWNDDSYDKFPFHHFSISSNDSVLSNFRRDMNVNYLTNKVSNQPILDTPNQRSLKRMPLKIQQLLGLTSINLFNGDLSFYHYMLSCYFNKLPPHEYINSHYMNLLTLNLFKQNENISTTNEVAKFHNKMFDKKTRQILKNQSSLRSIKLYSESSKSSRPISAPQSSQYQQGQPQQHYSQHPADIQGLPIKEEEIQLLQNTLYDYKSYGAVNPLNHPLNTYGHIEDSNFAIFDRFVNFAADLKQRLTGKNNNFDLESGMTFRELLLNTENDDSNDEDMGEIRHENDASSYSSRERHTTIREKYEIRYMRNYDEILSIIYFSFFFISLFISGIIMGIVYSLVELSTEKSQFLIEDNVFLILLIIIGLLLSLIFSIISINLNLSRYQKGPTWHSILVWSGAGFVCLSFIWSLVILFE